MSKRRSTTLHVSLDGDDRAPGTTEAPLATPHGALAAIRRLRRTETAPRAFTVVLRGGTYPLARTLTFTPQDSGTAGAPVVFCAHRGEAVVLSGGRRVDGWRKTKVHGKPCWVTALPDVKDKGWNFTQLFVNGRRRPRTRLPRTGWFRFRDYVVESDRTPAWHKGPRRMHYEGDDLQRWKNSGDIRIIAPEYWFVSHHRIRRIDTKRRIVHFKAHSVASLSDEKSKCARFRVENVFEALDTPGQWYLNRKTGKLYYMPLPDETPDAVVVTAPRLETLVHFAGTARRPVSHIRLENLSLQHAEWDYPDDDTGSVQAAFKVPGAVVMRAARHCVLYGCEVAHATTYGIETREGCHDNRIVACSLHDLGAGGVRIGHEWMPRVDETSTRVVRKISELPSATTVSDCRVHDVGKIHLNAAGIWIGNAGGNRIVHNEVFNVPYTGISCGWTWSYEPTAAVDNRIEDNHIHHIAWDRVLSDNGGIYTLGLLPGSTILRNHIHHVGCYGYGGTGIYMDEGTCELRIENNIVHHTTNAGCFTHVGRDIVIRNNIFALAKTQHVRPGNRAAYRANVFAANIFYYREGQLERTSWGLQPCEWTPEHCRFDDNLFFNAAGDVTFGQERTLADLQAMGRHLSTIVADPLFADPDAGDFTLREDSPAVALGFKPFTLPNAGPRVSAKRPASYARWPKDVFEPRAIVRTRFEQTGPGAVRMTLTNVGSVKASGRLRLAAAPEPAAKIAGQRSVAFKDLAPGATESVMIALRIDEDAELVTLESIPQSECLVPAMHHLEK